MNNKDWQKGFIQGYTCASATIIKSHGEETIAEDVYECNFYTVEELRKNGVDEQDIEILKPIIKEIERTRHL